MKHMKKDILKLTTSIICLVGKPTGRFLIEADDTEYGKVSYVRFHMLFGFRPASGRESVPLVCPRCRLGLPAHNTST